MVLDNTGSMAGTKIATLITAANKLVDSLAAATQDPANLRTGLVPFSQRPAGQPLRSVQEAQQDLEGLRRDPRHALRDDRDL
jgi:hypothetical protein